MDERVVSSPHVFTYLAVAFSTEAPSTTPAGWWWVTCSLRAALSPLLITYQQAWGGQGLCSTARSELLI